MLHINAPVIIKIREGVTINLSQTVSQAVERDLPQNRLKKEIADKIKSGAMTDKPKEEDYEQYATAHTLSFWFIGGTSLSYRVGHEITVEDFNRIEKIMNSLQFRTKDDGKPSDDKSAKKA
jgi:uncharacterized protein YneR